jgi:PAS domain S-box-containing protein
MAPPILLLFLAGIFVGRDVSISFEPPLLLSLLNTVFLTALPLVLAVLALRSFVEQGPRVLVLLGCGLVAPAVGGLLAGWGLMANGANYNVTVHNVGVLIGGGCHIGAAAMLLAGSPRKAPRKRTAALIGAGAYAAAALLVSAAALLTVNGLLPVFFVPGRGATMAREAVLTAAGICYLLSAALIFGLQAQTGMAFFRLYANALFLMAIGLAAVAVTTNTGSLVDWTGRAAQYTGSLYFVGALLVGSRETRRRGVSLPAYLSELMRSHLEGEIKDRTRELLALNDRLRGEIAERKELGARLQESGERLRFAAEAAGFGVFSFDFRSRQTYASPELLELFGLPRGAELPMDPERVPPVVHPDDRSRLASIARGLGDPAGPDLFDTEFRVLSPAGEERWLRARGRTTFDRSSGIALPARVNGIVQDVTRQKRAEEIAREREETYRSVIENSLQGIAIIQDGTIALCNEALCRISGYSMEETLRMTAEEVVAAIHPGDRQRVSAGIQTIADAGETPPMEVVRLLDKSGRLHWVEVLGGRTLYRGRPAIQVSYMDVTSRRSAERAYQTLVDNAPDGYAIVQREKVVFANAALAGLSGYSTDDLLRMNVEEIVALVHPDDRSRVIRSVEARVAGFKPPAIQRFRFRHREGSWRTIEAQSVLVDHEGAPALQVLCKDVTEAIAAQEDLNATHKKMRNLAAHLLRAREEERRNVAQEVHDELGQALAALKMDLHWLEQHARQGPAADQKLRDMIELGEHAIGAVQRISSDLRPRMLDDLGLAPALDWLASDFRRRTGMPCEMSISVPPGRIGGNAANSLYRVVQEALSNVVRHSLARRVEVRLALEEEVVLLSVKDDGIGINHAQASAVDSFGLIGARERIEGLGGTLLVVGEPGHGTVLTARIPVPPGGGLA